MKKYSKVISIILIVILALSLSACGGETLGAKFGLTAVAEGDQEYDEDMLKSAMGENYAEENYIKFNIDKTFTMTFMQSTVNGEYKKKGNDITLTSNEEETFGTVKGTVDGNTFIIEEEGMKMTFTRM